MNKKIIKIFDYCGTSGSGVEEVNQIFNSIELLNVKNLEVLEFDFDQIRVISTKFSGRFLERISILRKKNPELKVRVENATRAIESAFEYQKKVKSK